MPEIPQGNCPVIPIETRMSDRDIALHILQHVESMDARLAALEDELAVFRPLLRRLAPAGGADMLTMIEAARELRTISRNGRHRT